MAEAVAAQVDDETRRLCKDIARITGGETKIDFGSLARDEEVTNTYEALMGTLKAARRKGLITFEGELLMLGQNDSTMIALTDSGEQHLTGAPAQAPPAQAPPAASDGDDETTQVLEAEPKTEEKETEEKQEEKEDKSEVAKEEERKETVDETKKQENEEKEEEKEEQKEEEKTIEEAAPAAPAAEVPAAVPSIEEQEQDKEQGVNNTLSGSKTAEEADKKWNVDMSYIDARTADPDRLEARRSSAASPEAGANGTLQGASKKDEDGTWNVDMSYINQRTSQVENLEGRKRSSMVDGGEVLAATSSSTRKEGDKWKVDTSYIDHRTEKVETLGEQKRASASTTDPALLAAVASATTKKAEDGKWKVSTEYINHRTSIVDNLDAAKQDRKEGESSVAISSSVKKEGGSWKVDTSYINHRTGDTANLERKTEAINQDEFADPATKKYPYEALKGGGNRPDDVNPSCKEQYLSEEEFQTIFGMSLADFSKLAKWKQQNMKKAKDVF